MEVIWYDNKLIEGFIMKKAEHIIEYKLLNKTWRRINKAIPKQYRYLDLFIAHHNKKDYELRKGGWTTDRYITIGYEIVKLKDEYILVDILCHEIAHQILGHIHYEDDLDSLAELDADHLGMFLAIQAKYDPEKLIEANKRFERWRKKGINKWHVKTHTSASNRVEKLEKHLNHINYE